MHVRTGFTDDESDGLVLMMIAEHPECCAIRLVTHGVATKTERNGYRLVPAENADGSSVVTLGVRHE